MTPSVRLLAIPLLLAASAAAQQPARIDAANAAEQARVRALVGDLGLPPLLPVLPDSPLDQMYYADRVHVPHPPVAPGDGGAPQMVDGFLPAGPSGTGTDKNEIFKYQIPGGYDPQDDPVPLVIAYHGYGSSAASVAIQTTIDEECNNRGWFYMAPTGIDDQLYGSPVSQQNTQAAVQFMLDNFAIDPDRIYMVGFSMGGGVTANFTARRRDPDGIMVAAIGIVSGTFDWTTAWFTGNSTIKTLLENPYNFGGTPLQFPYEYQRASALYFSAGSYPPAPGVLEFMRSMATNLGPVPTYVTWDLGDTLPEVVSQEPVFVGLMAGLGGTLVSKPVVGTPAPKHSWAVLDEVDLFNFFQGKVVQRRPQVFEALVEESKTVAWVDVEQAAPGDFTHLDALALPATATASVSGVTNAATLRLHLDQAGFEGAGPFDIAGQADDGHAFALVSTGAEAPAAWMLDEPAGTLAPDLEGEPEPTAVSVVVPAFGLRQLSLVTDPAYISRLSSAPEPAVIGQNVTVAIDAPHGVPTAWLILGVQRALVPAKGSTLLVQVGPPAQVLLLGLDGNGDVVLTGPLPNSPLLSGVEVVFQAALSSGSQLHSLTNLWVMDIE